MKASQRTKMLSADMPSTTNVTIKCSELKFVIMSIFLYITSVIGNEKRIMDIDVVLTKAD